MPFAVVSDCNNSSRWIYTVSMETRSFARRTGSPAAGKNSSAAWVASPETAGQESGERSLSIAGLLECAEMSSVAPELLAGGDELSSTIRWLHLADSEHVQHFLEGGELVLTPTTTRRRSAAAMPQ